MLEATVGVTTQSGALETIGSYLSDQAKFDAFYAEMKRVNMLSSAMGRGGFSMPSPEHVKQWFGNTQKGLAYAAKEWGKEGTIGNVVITNAVLDQGRQENHLIAYDTDSDTLYVTFTQLAALANHYENPSIRIGTDFEDRLPVGASVSYEAYTILQAVEEAKHAHQVKGPDDGLPSIQGGDHSQPREQAIGPVWVKAIKDLGIQTQVA